MIKRYFIWARSPGYPQGVMWAILTALVSIINDVTTKFVGNRLNVLEISFFRFFFSMITILPFMIAKGKESFITARIDLHIWRAVIGLSAIGLYVYSLTLLPLAEVIVFSFTQPLFFLPLAILFLKEHVSFNRWVAGFFGFIGILIIVRPGSESFNLFAIIPMGAAFLFAVLDLLAKKMVAREQTITLLFYFALGTTLVAFIPLLFVWQTPTFLELGWLFILGAGANLIQVCLFQAFSATDASSLVPFRYIEFVFAAILGFLFFHEVISIYVFIGAIVIILSTLYMTYAEIRQKKITATNIS